MRFSLGCRGKREVSAYPAVLQSVALTERKGRREYDAGDDQRDDWVEVVFPAKSGEPNDQASSDDTDVA